MANLAATANYSIIEKEWRGQRVVTLKEVDEVHGRKPGTAKNALAQNRDKLLEGEDYFKIPKNELSGFLPPNSNRGNPKIPIILLTKSGYLMLVKSLNDEKAWNIQRVLVDSYFDKTEPVVPEIQQPQALSTELNPELQMFKALFDNAVEQDKRIMELDEKVEKIEQKMKSGFELPETTKALDSLFLNPVTLYTTTDIAKAFNLSAMAVNRYLLAQDIHSPHKKGWRLHEKYRDCGYVHQKTGKFKNSEGEKEECLMTWWTATGKDFVCALLKNAGLKQKGKIKPYDRHGSRGKRKRR